MTDEKFQAKYFEGRIIVPNEDQANKIHNHGATGKPLSEGRLQLSPVEALYLLDQDKLEITDEEKDEELNFDTLSSKIAEEDSDIMLKYRLYRDLKSRGFVIKTGLKYGSHFRVYDRGEKPGTDHSPYLVHAISENKDLTPQEIARSVRLAHGVRKKMIFGIVDDEGDITYYSVNREKL